MQLDDLMELCRQFSNLGWAVQSQLRDVVAGDDLDEQNPNALKMCASFLREAAALGVEGASDVADDIKRHLDQPVT